MIKRLYTLFIIIGVALGAMAQMAEPVKFSVSEKINDKGQLEISFRGTIEEGWHVYGTNIPEGGPTATTITLEKQDGVKPIDGIKTIGDVHRGLDPMFGVEVETIEKEVTFVQTYEVDKEGYNISGYLTFGACNDENCLPPTTVDFSFKSGNTTTTEATETKAEAVAETNNTAFGNDLWAPVTGQLKSDDDVTSQTDASLLWIFLMGMGGGLLALLTPCVWPIIPMTVSFFLKRSKDNRRTDRSQHQESSGCAENPGPEYGRDTPHPERGNSESAKTSDRVDIHRSPLYRQAG